MDDAQMREFYAQSKGRVQFGPVYRCWICGEPVLGVRAYADAHRGSRTFLDRYGPHLAYLVMGPSCKNAHPCRVVVVGPAITPVDLDVPTLEERFARIEEAIDLLTRVLAEKREAGSSRRGSTPPSRWSSAFAPASSRRPTR